MNAFPSHKRKSDLRIITIHLYWYLRCRLCQCSHVTFIQNIKLSFYPNFILCFVYAYWYVHLPCKYIVLLCLYNFQQVVQDMLFVLRRLGSVSIKSEIAEMCLSDRQCLTFCSLSMFRILSGGHVQKAADLMLLQCGQFIFRRSSEENAKLNHENGENNNPRHTVVWLLYPANYFSSSSTSIHVFVRDRCLAIVCYV